MVFIWKPNQTLNQNNFYFFGFAWTFQFVYVNNLKLWFRFRKVMKVSGYSFFPRMQRSQSGEGEVTSLSPSCEVQIVLPTSLEDSMMQGFPMVRLLVTVCVWVGEWGWNPVLSSEPHKLLRTRKRLISWIPVINMKYIQLRLGEGHLVQACLL